MKWNSSSSASLNSINTNRAAAVITAAGSSSRMGGGQKKEYLLLDDRPLLQHTLQPFLNTNIFSHIVITVPPGGEKYAKEALGELFLNKTEITITPGGASRQESVYNGLRALESTGIDQVLIHDGARPWISEDLIMAVLQAARTYGAAAPVIDVVDTMKKINLEGFITEHLMRSQIKGIQTPQGFNYLEIIKAHGKAKTDGTAYTDDTEIYSAYFGPVFTVPGELNNIKVTYPQDLEGKV